MGGSGIKKYPDLHDVIYGQPLSLSYEVCFDTNHNSDSFASFSLLEKQVKLDRSHELKTKLKQ